MIFFMLLRVKSGYNSKYELICARHTLASLHSERLVVPTALTIAKQKLNRKMHS
ncbi:hypothetical protein DSUL_60132 [Desulfovibrionales bacterium]